jgi:hypothetical protein
VRIPEFQRPLRWQWEDVRRLFDSIVKGYPIGNLLLWQRPAPAARIVLGALSLDAPAFSDGWWVVDGQQRLISLANALGHEGARDERFALAYDLRTEEFSRPPQVEHAYVVPLPVLFDLQQLLRWFATHREASEKLDAASRVTKAIREFSIPAYVVEQQDEAVLRDIFDRMNNYGKRLSRAEVFSALHPGQVESIEPHSRFGNIVETIDRERGFGELDEDTVLRAVLARRGGDVTREIRLEFTDHTRDDRDFGDESAEVAYREGERAIVRAVTFLQDDAGVPHFAFLPYRYLLVVLARFFAHFPNPDPRNLTLLRRWFWRAAMIGPGVFSGSWTHAMRTLATRITPHNEAGSVEQLLRAPIDRSFAQPALTRFRTNGAQSRVALCALWSLTPRSLTTGKPYGRQDLIEAIPAGGTPASVVERIVRHEPAGHRMWAANRILVLEDKPTYGVAELLTVPRLGLGNQAVREVLASHVLSEDLVAALSRGDAVSFLEGRQPLIEAAVRSFLSRMAEPEFEDTPPLGSLDLDDHDHDDEERDDAGE